MPPPSSRQRTRVEYVVLGGIRRTATAEEVADSSASGGQIACRLLEKHGKFDRDNVCRLTALAA